MVLSLSRLGACSPMPGTRGVSRIKPGVVQNGEERARVTTGGLVSCPPSHRNGPSPARGVRPRGSEATRTSRLRSSSVILRFDTRPVAKPLCYNRRAGWAPTCSKIRPLFFLYLYVSLYIYLYLFYLTLFKTGRTPVRPLTYQNGGAWRGFQFERSFRRCARVLYPVLFIMYYICSSVL